MAKVLVVGAGFAGAVYARELAEAGFSVHLIDKRPHIAGNCFDYIHETGVRIHKYGPHLFHTSNERVVSWLSKFTNWIPYEHQVVARLPSGINCPMPINLETINTVFNQTITTTTDAEKFLDYLSERRPAIKSAEDYLVSKIGKELTNLFFRPYTKKMWGMDLCEIDAAVVQRLTIRTDFDRRYFPNDTFQAMPVAGYVPLFENILAHDKISVSTSTSFDRESADSYDMCFNSMPIDEYFGYEFGELPYRSIKFHSSEVTLDEASSYATINYTDMGPYTRETWWHQIAGHWVSPTDKVIRTIEEPCDYRDNDFERYYPVKTSDKRYDTLYQRYLSKASADEHMNFIGRCGTYQYLDMHQVINQSLVGVNKWLNRARTI